MTADSPLILDLPFEEYTGITFVEGETFVTVEQSGVYRIHYNIKTVIANGATLQLLVNDELVENSGIPMLLDVADRTGVCTRILQADDTVSIRIVGTNVTLAPGTNAFLDLIRLANAPAD